MSNPIETLFAGNFYIDRSYGAGLVPTLIKLFKGGDFVEKKESDLIQKITRISVDSKTITNGSLQSSGSESRVVVLDFKQPVVKFSTYYWLGTQTYIAILNQLKNDPTVAGVVLDMDTGGGQVYGTPEMYDVVSAFKEVKPLVVYTNGYMCSGGYYIAAPASFIIANKRADAIGSIGAYTTIVNYDGILEKFGAKIHTIYSDLSDDKNKGYRGVIDGTDPEFKNYITEELNPMVITFHNDMKNARPQLNEAVFKGGTWTGEQSIAMGLIDANGSIQDAVAKVFELAAAKNSNSNNNNNSKKETMSKKTKGFPVLQGIIGIEGEGIKTISTVLGNTGVQISEAQLEAIENALVEKDTAVTTANTKVTTAESRVTAIEGAINTAVATAGLEAKVEAEATLENKITLLGATVLAYGKKPGAKVTTPPAEGDHFEEDNIVDANAAHNKAYNQA